jgi:COMPASS component BRE2
VKEHRENPFDDGTLGYYPFISLFNEAAVCLNPGPDFDFPPPLDIDVVLDGKPTTSSSDASARPAAPLMISTETDTKPIIDSPEIKPPLPDLLSTTPDVKSCPTWRPACERYPEFMQEEWAFDATEDDLAKVEHAKYAAAEKVEEDRRKQREKKKQQADARKKARKAAAEQVATAALGEEEREREREKEREEKERYGSLPALGMYSERGGHNHPSPSPLRYSTAYEPEGSVEYENSPAPTFASYGDFQGGQSGYTSENHDLDMEVDQDIEAIIAVDPPTPA